MGYPDDRTYCLVQFNLGRVEWVLIPGLVVRFDHGLFQAHFAFDVGFSSLEHKHSWSPALYITASFCSICSPISPHCWTHDVMATFVIITVASSFEKEPYAGV